MPAQCVRPVFHTASPRGGPSLRNAPVSKITKRGMLGFLSLIQITPDPGGNVQMLTECLVKLQSDEPALGWEF